MHPADHLDFRPLITCHQSYVVLSRDRFENSDVEALIELSCPSFRQIDPPPAARDCPDVSYRSPEGPRQQVMEQRNIKYLYMFTKTDSTLAADVLSINHPNLHLLHPDCSLYEPLIAAQHNQKD